LYILKCAYIFGEDRAAGLLAVGMPATTCHFEKKQLLVIFVTKPMCTGMRKDGTRIHCPKHRDPTQPT
jgi:hypothetical protein